MCLSITSERTEPVMRPRTGSVGRSVAQGAQIRARSETVQNMPVLTNNGFMNLQSAVTVLSTLSLSEVSDNVLSAVSQLKHVGFSGHQLAHRCHPNAQ
jgi:hypothetical protein